MLPRPKPGDSEDDLLKFQREFLANQTQASATVVRRGDKRKSGIDDGIQNTAQRDVVEMEALPSVAPSEDYPVKKSRFRQSQEQKTKSIVDTAFDPEDEMEKHDTHMSAVLSKIIERDTRNVHVSLPNPCTDGFPKVTHLEQKATSSSMQRPGKKRSLFAQQFSGTGVKDFSQMLEQETSKVKGQGEPEEMDTTEENKNVDTGSHIIEGIGLSATFGKDEAIKIHQENVQKLQSMSAEEIAEEQRKLLDVLDPKLVEFLRKKRTIKEETHQHPVIEQTNSGSKSHRIKQQVKLDEDDLPVKPKKEWAHMEKLEYDKLEWMKDLPPPATDNKATGQHARFDFHGNLMSADADIPVNIGLHHHGDEPERPGYTLDELFHLARSTNNQQRSLALQTLSHVICRVRNGELEALVQSPVLPALIDAGVMFLLRWALDDSVEMVVSSAIAALCSLLVSDADEARLDKVFSWHQGHSVPKHQPRSSGDDDESKKKSNEEETPEEEDADLLKRDIILCLVTRMNFLPRLKYILTKTKPQAPTIINILKILCRIAHHSTKIAYDIFLCPGLLDTILQEFLPTSWSLEDTGQPLSNIYGIPVAMAMRLMRCLVQAGKNMAAILMTDNQLQSRLLRYMVEINPISLNLPELEAYQLQTESYRTWKVCLFYGLATEIYIDMFPIVIDKLRNLEEHITNDTITSYQIENYVAFVGALEAVVHVAGSNNSQQAKFNRSQEGQSMEVGGSESIAMPTINWGHVADLLNPVSRSLAKIMSYTKDNYQFKKTDLTCAIACTDFITSYYSRLCSQAGQNTVQYLQQIETYCDEVLVACWQSIGFRVIFERLSQFSNILNSPEEKRRELVKSLPALGCSSVKEERMLPVLRNGTPYGFVTALLRQVYTLCQIHKGIQDKMLSIVLHDGDIGSYMKKVAGCKQGHLHSNYFTRFENLLQYYYVKLCVMLQEDKNYLHTSILQCLTLKLLTRLHHGDEFMAHDLFSTVVFRPSLWRKPSEDEALLSLENMRLSDGAHLRSATQEEITFTCTQLTAAARSQLPSIRATYIKAFSYFEKEAFHSRNLFHMNPHEIKSFLTSSIEEFLLPSDWMYMPLIYLYNHFSSVGTEVQNALSVGETETVSHVLKWIFLLERDQPNLMSAISVTLKISRLMCTFLTGNDLFLDRTVHCYLAAFLREYTKPVYLDKMDFEESIPGILSFYDFYITVLHQFEAVSFGDSLFCCYILIPLQQKHGLELRRSIWTEHRGILRTLYLPVKEMLIPIEQYLDPEETNTEMIRLYYECLFSLTVRPRWAPVLYLVAVHHVNRFMYTQDSRHTKLKHAMLKEGLRGQNKDLCHHLLYYKQADVSREYGIELYQTLPDIRQHLIDSLK